MVQQCSTTQGQSVSKAKKIIIMYFSVCDQNILGESAQISVDSIVFLPCNFPKRMTIRGLLSFYWWLEEKTRLKTNWTWTFSYCCWHLIILMEKVFDKCLKSSLNFFALFLLFFFHCQLKIYLRSTYKWSNLHG